MCHGGGHLQAIEDIRSDHLTIVMFASNSTVPCNQRAECNPWGRSKASLHRTFPTNRPPRTDYLRRSKRLPRNRDLMTVELLCLFTSLGNFRRVLFSTRGFRGRVLMPKLTLKLETKSSIIRPTSSWKIIHVSLTARRRTQIVVRKTVHVRYILKRKVSIIRDL